MTTNLTRKQEKPIRGLFKRLAKKAEFVFWGKNENSHGSDQIDWASCYDKELIVFATEIVRECADIDYQSKAGLSAEQEKEVRRAILKRFKVKQETRK